MDLLAEMLDASLRETQPVRRLILGFNELRALVVGTYDKGETLKEYGGTFSHGNTGNAFQDLAHKVDQLVSSGEPNKNFVLAFEEDLIKREKDFADTFGRIQDSLDELKVAGQTREEEINSLRVFSDKIQVALGTYGIDREETYKELHRLCEVDEELEALKLQIAEDKKTARKKAGARRR